MYLSLHQHWLTVISIFVVDESWSKNLLFHLILLLFSCAYYAPFFIYPGRIPFSYLEDIQMRFMKNYSRVANYAPAYAMNDEFSRVLHQQMEFFSSNPSVDTLNRVRGEVGEASNSKEIFIPPYSVFWCFSAPSIYLFSTFIKWEQKLIKVHDMIGKVALLLVYATLFLLINLPYSLVCTASDSQLEHIIIWLL